MFNVHILIVMCTFEVIILGMEIVYSIGIQWSSSQWKQLPIVRCVFIIFLKKISIFIWIWHSMLLFVANYSILYTVYFIISGYDILYHSYVTGSKLNHGEMFFFSTKALMWFIPLKFLIFTIHWILAFVVRPSSINEKT